MKGHGMTVHPSDPPRSAAERRVDSTLPVFRELGEPLQRENKLKSGLHPSLRALPDYPAR